jgi:WD40 repeat protein
LTGSDDGTVRVWDARTGAELLALQGHTAGVQSASFSPNGLRIITGSRDRTARLWDARTGAEVLTLKGHTDRVNTAMWSADGARVLTCGEKIVKVWDGTPVPKTEGPVIGPQAGRP